jgi:hypothetical protein
VCVQSDDGSRNRLHREPMLAWRRRWRWTRDNRQEESGKEKTGPLGGPWHTRQLANDTDGPDEGGPPGPEKCCAIRLGGIRNEDSTRTRTRPATAHDVKRPRVQPRAGPVLSMQETRHQRSNVRLARGCALAQFAPASLTSTPPGTGAGMETEEAARQCTALAMILKSRAHTAARKLRRRGCCGSASSAALHGAHIIVHTLTTTQSSHSWWKGRLSVACHVEGPPAYHDGRRSAYSSTNSWASNRSNLHERSVQLTLHERLRAFDLRVSHSPCLR